MKKRMQNKGRTTLGVKGKVTSAILVMTVAMLLLPIAGISSTSASTGWWNNQDLPGGNMRETPLDVKIVFIGIKQQYVNISDGYFQRNLPPYHVQRETWYGTNWGVNYTFTYSYVFNQTFDTEFFLFLNAIRKDDNVLINPYTGLPTNRFYNANQVEDWLYTRPQGYGGIPTTGYVLFLINVTRLDTQEPTIRPHYYNLTYTDVDSSVTVTRNWYGRWMTNWGGHHRLYFVDVSAGANPILVQAWNPAQQWWNHYFPPIWSLNINLNTKNGINFLNEYLSDFVFGAVYGLYTNDFLYPPRIAPNLHYNITITIFDNCTNYHLYPIDDPLGGVLPPYDGTYAVNKNMILDAFKKLIPYATWTVNLTYIHLNGTPDGEPYRTLWSVIRNAERTKDPFGNPVSYVDRNQLYHYLQDNLMQFVTPVAGQLLIPVFVFVFKDGFNLGYQYEGYEYDNYWGFGYPDVVLVSHSVTDLLGGGGMIPFGFTQTIIHETGHAVGLAHPFWWDWDEDFVASAMAYYPYEYSFSQFDMDAIQRGHADYYVIRAQSMMENATELLQWKQMNSSLLALYANALGNQTEALSDYGLMDYENAMIEARTALNLLTQFVEGASQAPPPTTTTTAVTTIVTTISGIPTTIVSTITGTTADYTIAIVVVVIIVVAVVAVGAIMLRRKPGK